MSHNTFPAPTAHPVQPVQPQPVQRVQPRYAAWPAGHYGPYPLFSVRVVEHTGALVAWVSQTRTVTGTYQQCLAAIAAAQRQNLIIGWWSPASLLVFNWMALDANRKARTALQQLAGVQA